MFLFLSVLLCVTLVTSFKNQNVSPRNVLLRNAFLPSIRPAPQFLSTECTLCAKENSRRTFSAQLVRNRLQVVLLAQNSQSVPEGDLFQNIPKNSQNFVILGGSGDLSTTKIIPGLFDLYEQLILSANNGKIDPNIADTGEHDASNEDLSAFNFDNFTIKLVARSNWSNDFMREKLSIILKKRPSSESDKTSHERLIDIFLQKCTYVCAPSYSTEIMREILGVQNDNNDSGNNGNKRNIVYFALPPKQYLSPLRAISEIRKVRSLRNVQKIEIAQNLEFESDKECGRTEINTNENIKNSNKENKNIKDDNIGYENNIDIVLEKPIGYDIITAREILLLALACVGNDKEKVWCVDHYVAKDLITGIIPLKTSKTGVLSTLFGRFFNGDYVEKVDISFVDSSVLDGRSGYFDDCGIIRDIITNHLIQLLALICSDTKGEYVSDDDDNINAINNMNDSNMIIDNKLDNIDENNNSDIDNKNIKRSRYDSISKEGDKKKINKNNKNNENTNGSDDADNSIQWDEISAEQRSQCISTIRSRVLHSIIVDHSDIIVGQYEGYRAERGVKDGSRTDTFASCVVQVPGPVWESTVFRLTAGKGLDGKESVIRMRYRKECHQEVLTAVRAIQQEYPKNIPKNVRENVPDDSSLESLSLIFQIQPNPGIYIEKQCLSQTTKTLLLTLDELPASEMKKMDKMKKMDAYERVLRSIIFTERKNEFFPSVLEVLLQWNIFDKALSVVEGGLRNKGGEGGEGVEEGAGGLKDMRGEKMEEGGEKKEWVEEGEGVGVSTCVKLYSYVVGSSIDSIINRTEQ